MTPAEVELVVTAISAIEKIIETVKSAKAGTTDPKAALDAINALHTSLANNNAAADTALDAKFKT